ncbi:MAG: hypothetical protein KGJ62_02465 [Armatimonadetes bacterium]|nr:hypothetical protein [Armatimonadota bacterium]MDE2205315.1 hypothetical protein [Armatimonadota bacterium]
MTAFFNGHIPPFAQPGGEPVHIRVILTYKATVQSVSPAGAVIDFSVDSADIGLLQKDPGHNGKVNPDAVIPFPLPLDEIQKTLNVTAVIRADGSIASLKTGTTTPVRIQLGFDIRRICLLMMPLIFPNKPLNANDTWAFDDGVLGKRLGDVTYGGTLVSATAAGGSERYQFAETALAKIDSKVDKDGNPTTSAVAAEGSLSGTAKLAGSVRFMSPAPADATTAGFMALGHFDLTVLLKRTRDKPDPLDPGAPLVSTIDIAARLNVQDLPPSSN